MVSRLLGILGLVVLVMLLAACDSSNTSNAGGTTSVLAAGSPKACSGYFEAVASDDGTELWQGTLALNVQASGDFTGTFTPKAGSSPAFTASKITGQATGRAINLAADLGGGQYLFGAGSLMNPISDCTGSGGGSFVVETVNQSSGGKLFNGLAAHMLNPPLQEKKSHQLGIWGYGLGG